MNFETDSIVFPTMRHDQIIFRDYYCTICRGQQNYFQEVTRKMIDIKYFEAFNFYFCKPINEILANVSVPNVILYKDAILNDPENEYLKRFYQLNEIEGKMNGLTQFYKTYKNPLPNLSVVEAAKIMIKRCMKFSKLFQKNQQLENIEEINQVGQQTNAESHENLLPSNILQQSQDSNMEYLQNQSTFSKELSQVEGKNKQKQLQTYQQYEKLLKKQSFESFQHNIYNPLSQNVSKMEQSFIEIDESVKQLITSKELLPSKLNQMINLAKKKLKKSDNQKEQQQTHAFNNTTQQLVQYRKYENKQHNQQKQQFTYKQETQKLKQQIIGKNINSKQSITENFDKKLISLYNHTDRKEYQSFGQNYKPLLSNREQFIKKDLVSPKHLQNNILINQKDSSTQKQFFKSQKKSETISTTQDSTKKFIEQNKEQKMQKLNYQNSINCKISMPNSHNIKQQIKQNLTYLMKKYKSSPQEVKKKESIKFDKQMLSQINQSKNLSIGGELQLQNNTQRSSCASQSRERKSTSRKKHYFSKKFKAQQVNEASTLFINPKTERLINNQEQTNSQKKILLLKEISQEKQQKHIQDKKQKMNARKQRCINSYSGNFQLETNIINNKNLYKFQVQHSKYQKSLYNYEQFQQKAMDSQINSIEIVNPNNSLFNKIQQKQQIMKKRKNYQCGSATERQLTSFTQLQNSVQFSQLPGKDFFKKLDLGAKKFPSPTKKKTRTSIKLPLRKDSTENENLYGFVTSRSFQYNFNREPLKLFTSMINKQKLNPLMLQNLIKLYLQNNKQLIQKKDKNNNIISELKSNQKLKKCE